MSQRNTRANADREMVDKVQRALRQREDGLDGETLSRLRRARAAALASSETPDSEGNLLGWMLGGSAVAALLAVLLVPAVEFQSNEPLPEDDLLAGADILLDSEVELELLAEQEFYQWLAEEALDGHSS